MRNPIVPLTLSAVLMAAGAAFALPASAATTETEGGTLIEVDPAQGTLVFADGEHVLLPDTQAMTQQLSQLKPGEVALVDVTARMPVVATQENVYLLPGQAVVVDVSAPVGDIALADAVWQQAPVTGQTVE